MRIVPVILISIVVPLSSPVLAKNCNIPQPFGCDIKGNITGKNDRLYHMPGDPGYASTKISKCGEQWFCTQQDAEKSGWKRAGSLKLGLPVVDIQDCIIPPEAPHCCPIKGNVATGWGNRGIRRYHLPGSPRYAETIVRATGGDRWLCSVEEARSAGFEAAGNFTGQTTHNYRDCVIPPDIPDEVFEKKCFIKGNISSSGRIYHVRGSRWYFETQITEQRQEKWFCTVAQAELEGWRAPKRPGPVLPCGPAIKGAYLAVLPGCPRVPIMPSCLLLLNRGGPTP